MTPELPKAVNLQFRLPAEWEIHAATWLAWPHNASDWPGKFTPIPWVYAEIVRHIDRGEEVRLLVENATHEARVRRLLQRADVSVARVEFLRWPTDRVWMRDSGPLWLKNSEGTKAIADLRFNAWAKYPDWRKDARNPARAAKATGAPLRPVQHRGQAVVLEGGAIDGNGRGSILATEECLLDPKVQVRNPGFTAADYETVFRENLGAGITIWLGRGIAGDDTHGHVDDFCRFTDAHTIVLCEEKDGQDCNHRVLEENRERLESARLENGSRPAIARLPMPAPVVFNGRRLPASYANFYLCNAAVLVPTFNDANDRLALGVLAELIPDRPVIGIHALDLVWGLGTLHCLSQQEPA